MCFNIPAINATAATTLALSVRIVENVFQFRNWKLFPARSFNIQFREGGVAGLETSLSNPATEEELGGLLENCIFGRENVFG